jgi:mono/diheme cytochrome c family protein
MRMRNLIFAIVFFMLWVVGAAAQNQPEKVIKHVPIASTSPASGEEMYKAYCAVCHGTTGAGNGPAASALKVPPTHLNTLSMHNGGKYPEMEVVSAIRGEGNLPAHGSREMPVWGQLFWTMSNGHEGEVQERVANLSQYIESLQLK